MTTIDIRDRTPRGHLIDLRDILPVLGPDALRSIWMLRGLECHGGEAAEALHAASDAGEALSGERLAELARGVGQIIDGQFVAFLPGETRSWVFVQAVDSTLFEVVTDRTSVVDALKARFRDLEIPDLPEESDYFPRTRNLEGA